jgi:Fe-S cluster biogenesis protein NfuA
MNLTMLNIFRRNRQPAVHGPLFGPVKKAMQDVRAYARSHGGDIELVDVSEIGDVTIKFRGACVGCPLSAVTLKHGVEERLRAAVPGVRAVMVG